MNRSSKKRKAPPAPRAKRASGKDAKQRIALWPVLAFVGRYCLWTVVFYALTLLPGYKTVLDYYIEHSVRVDSWILNLFGEQTTVEGATIKSGLSAVTIIDACMAIQFMVFAAAAICAFPARLKQKCVGIMATGLAIEAANHLRIMTLHLTNYYRESAFDLVHLEIWPGVLVVVTLGVTLAWIKWAIARPIADGSHVPA